MLGLISIIFIFSLSKTTTNQGLVFQERKGTAKLDYLRKIEREIQEQWEKQKTFECDAPTTIGESTK